MWRRTPPLVLIASLLFVNTAVLADVEITKKPAADDFSSEVASAWFELLYDVVKAERTTPPVASRIYGIAAVALYEGIVPGAQANRSLVGQLNGLISLPGPKQTKKYHWPTVQIRFSPIRSGVCFRPFLKLLWTPSTTGSKASRRNTAAKSVSLSINDRSLTA